METQDKLQLNLKNKSGIQNEGTCYTFLYQIVPQFCLQTQTLCSELVFKMFAVAIQRLRFSVSRNLLS